MRETGSYSPKALCYGYVIRTDMDDYGPKYINLNGSNLIGSVGFVVWWKPLGKIVINWSSY